MQPTHHNDNKIIRKVKGISLKLSDDLWCHMPFNRTLEYLHKYNFRKHEDQSLTQVEADQSMYITHIMYINMHKHYTWSA